MRLCNSTRHQTVAVFKADEKVVILGCRDVRFSHVTVCSGLVHESEIVSDKRGTNLSDKVKHNQVVYVKLLSVTGTKLNLSMRDIDQATGQDLKPRKAAVSLVCVFLASSFYFCVYLHVCVYVRVALCSSIRDRIK